MKLLAFRLKTGQLLKEELEALAKREEWPAAFIVTAVGSLSRASLRLADESLADYEENFEIVSLIGTLSVDGAHLHISLADKNGPVLGGHLKDNCRVYTTVELVIGISDEFTFKRVFDKDTGFNELLVENHS